MVCPIVHPNRSESHRHALAWVRRGAVCLALAVAAVGTPPALGAEPPSAYDLDRCIQTALDHNFDLRKARERVVAQGGAVTSARALMRPRLGAAGQFEQQADSRLQDYGFAKSSDVSWSADLELAQTLYAGGAPTAGLRSQERIRDSALSDLAATMQEVVLQVREGYYAVLLARAEVDVQEQNIKLLEEELQSAKNRLEAGAVAPIEALRAEVALANGQTPLIRARNNSRLALEDLRRVLGLDGEREPLAVTGELTAAPAAASLDEALAEAQQQRPELRRLRQLVEAGDADLSAARAGNRPKIEAYGGYGAFSDPLSGDASDEMHGWKAGVRLNWSLFDSFATKGVVLQAASRKAQEQLELDQARQAIEVEVRRAHSSLQESVELLNATGKVVEQAEESLRMVRSRYEVGAATQLDVLDSRVALLSARLNRQQAIYGCNVAQARLERAVGRGGETTPSRAGEQR